MAARSETLNKGWMNFYLQVPSDNSGTGKKKTKKQKKKQKKSKKQNNNNNKNNYNKYKSKTVLFALYKLLSIQTYYKLQKRNYSEDKRNDCK